MKNTNKGITLIALVITIIVMLILVGVTISMAVNGGLFNYAGNAVEETQNALDAEGQLANGAIKVGDTWYDSIDDYIAGRGWVTIYEGEATTEGGEIILSEEACLFKSGYSYRITVESLEEGGYTGTVETVATLVGMDGELEEYSLFMVKEGNAIGLTSAGDLNEIISNFDEEKDIMFYGVNVTGSEGLAVSGVAHYRGKYKLTKIEECVKPQEGLIFSGLVVLTQRTDFEGTDRIWFFEGFQLDTNKTYEFTYVVGDVISTGLTQKEFYNESWLVWKVPVLETGGVIILDVGQAEYNLTTKDAQITILEIREIQQ